MRWHTSHSGTDRKVVGIVKAEKKAEIMKRASDDITPAKDRLYRAVQTLEESGMSKDAEQLMKMIYRIESFQTKYDRYRVF